MFEQASKFARYRKLLSAHLSCKRSKHPPSTFNPQAFLTLANHMSKGVASTGYSSTQREHMTMACEHTHTPWEKICHAPSKHGGIRVKVFLVCNDEIYYCSLTNCNMRSSDTDERNSPDSVEKLPGCLHPFWGEQFASYALRGPIPPVKLENGFSANLLKIELCMAKHVCQWLMSDHLPVFVILCQ